MDPKNVAILTALAYVEASAHAEHYLFPVTVAHSSGTHGSKRELKIALVHRSVLIEAIKSERALDTRWLRVSDNVLKVNKLSETALRKTFGSRVTFLSVPEFYSTYSALPLDPTPCAGPRARTFEKLACKAVGAQWVGALHGVQVDGVLKFYDKDSNPVKVRFEVKGLGGRITAFMPSEVDPDGKE